MNSASGKHFDVIVLGVGSMGSATCFYLAKQGQNVLGLEQFDIPNEHGSHGGQSRIIRKAYFEHPDYVPLLTKHIKIGKILKKRQANISTIKRVLYILEKKMPQY